LALVPRLSRLSTLRALPPVPLLLPRVRLFPAFLVRPRRGAGRTDVGDRDELSGLLEQLGLDARVLAQRGVLGRVLLGPGAEERVLRGLEPAPHFVLIGPTRPAGRLP